VASQLVRSFAIGLATFTRSRAGAELEGVISR